MSSRYYSKRIRVIKEKAANLRGERARPKSFKTEDAAKKWAEKNNVKDYNLRNLKNDPNKKIVIETL